MSLLPREKISRVFWEPYILTGYRETNTTLWQCIKYIFVIHNDWGNFWTHFIPFWVWLYWVYHLSYKLDFFDSFWYPYLMLCVGGCSYALCSSIAHAFASKSEQVQHICFMIDYHGISIYAFGGSIAYYFYERPIGVHFFQYQWTFTTWYMLIALYATLMCSMSRFFWEKHRFIMRALSFALPYIAGCFPYFSRLVPCILTGRDCIVETIPLHLTAFFISHGMPFFFVSKVPERLYPGRFDYYLQSHQLFHIAGALMTSFKLYMLPIDAIARRTALMNDHVTSDFYSTFVPMFCVIILGFLIVFVMSALMMKGILVSTQNKVKSN